MIIMKIKISGGKEEIIIRIARVDVGIMMKKNVRNAHLDVLKNPVRCPDHLFNWEKKR